MTLRIADKCFDSRIFIGTAHYPSQEILNAAIAASQTQMVTVSMRRFNPKNSQMSDLLPQLLAKNITILPNTAGCYTAKEAILTAQLAREALNTNWIKLEVIGDEKTLFPDVIELLKAAEILMDEGFVILAYTNDDLIVCQKLADLGCAAVMPLGSPIGSGMGMINPYNLQMIRAKISIPLILDAGIGTASDVAKAMELGLDGVLINTAIAQATDPVAMANAMCLAAQAGRLAYQAGRIPKKTYAQASSPLEGVIVL